MIKVSVVIPVYNAQNYLNRCLDSIINQTLKELEIITVNDGSTDDSLNILNRYKIQDNRIKIIDQKNSGTGIARNNGIKIAKGEYITFIDADDTIEETMIEKLYKKILQEQSDMVVCNINRVDSKLGKKIGTRVYSDIDKVTFFKYILSFQYKSFVWAKLYKKSLFLTNNILFPPELKHNEDNATFFKFVYYAKKVTFLKEYLYNWMIVENSKSGTISKERLDSINSVLTIRYNFLKKHNIYNIYEKDFLVGMLKLLELRIKNVLISNNKELIDYIIEIIIKLDFFTKINLLKVKKTSKIRYFMLLRAILKLEEKSILLDYFPKQDIDIIKYYSNQTLEFYQSILDQLKEQNIKDFYIYGAGKYCIELLPYLKNNYNILGIIDRDYEVLDNYISNYKIGSIEEIIKDNKNTTIVITSRSSIDEISDIIKGYSSEINIIHCFNF